MRHVVKNANWKDDYDDLSSFDVAATPVGELHPSFPAPNKGKWHDPVLTVEKSARNRHDLQQIAAVVLIALLFLALIGGATLQGSSSDFSSEVMGVWYLAIAVGLIGTALWVLNHFSSGPIAPAHLKNLADQTGLHKRFPVHIRVAVDGVEIGTDDGLVAFEHDLLVFEGIESNFAIGVQDLLGTTYCTDFTHNAVEGDITRPRLIIRHPDSHMSICLSPWSRLTAEDKRDCAFRFRRELRLFLHAWRPAQLARTLPPDKAKEKSGRAVRMEVVSSVLA